MTNDTLMKILSDAIEAKTQGALFWNRNPDFGGTPERNKERYIEESAVVATLRDVRDTMLGDSYAREWILTPGSPLA